MTTAQLTTVFAQTSELDTDRAVADLRRQLGEQPGSLLVFYASPKADFPDLASKLHTAMGTPSIGCTTAGEVSNHGHAEDSIVVVLITSPAFVAQTTLITDASEFNVIRAREEIEPMLEGETPPSFGIVLIDGLSGAEEQVCASLGNALRETPFVGGSAGDDLNFETTWVAVNGRAAQNAAAFALVRTGHPFKVFQAHHFEATDERLVITGAIPSERRVTEINGEPAAEGYARAVGVHVDELYPMIFAAHPIMISIGGAYYVRSIQRVNEDGSLTFYCAIDEGLVLRVAKGHSMPANLSRQLEELGDEIDDPGLILGFDCILRRLEMLNRDQRDEIRSVLARYPVVGFNTYGEQLNGLHMNQTLTGVAIGRAA